MSACDDRDGVCYGAQGRGDMQRPCLEAGLALVWASQEERRERLQLSTVKQWQVAQARAEAVVDVVTAAWGVQIKAVLPVRHIAHRAAPARNIVGAGVTKEYNRVQDENRGVVHRQGGRCAGGWKVRGCCQAQLSASLQNGHAKGCNTVTLACRVASLTA
jgi:hypothetical protein